MAPKPFITYAKSFILDVAGSVESSFCYCCRQFQAHVGLLYHLSILISLKLGRVLQRKYPSWVLYIQGLRGRT